MTGLVRRHPLAAAVVVALALRLGAAACVELSAGADGGVLVSGDAEGYLDLAADLAAGDPYAIDSGVFPRRAMRAPGFPLALAGPVWVDRRLGAAGFLLGSHLFARLSVAICGALTVWATGRLGEAVAGRRAGVVAAWIAAVNPLAVAFSVMLLSETLFALLVTLSLWGVAECVRPDETRAKPSSRWQPAVWAGLAAAGATLTRPVWLPFAPCVCVLAIGLAWRGQRPGPSEGPGRCGSPGAVWVVPFGLAFLVGFAPWPLRNRAVLGEPVLTTTWGGPTLYDSLGPQATGESDMRFFEPPEGTPGPARFPMGDGVWLEWDSRLMPPEDREAFQDLWLRAESAVDPLVTDWRLGSKSIPREVWDREFVAKLSPEDRALIERVRLREAWFTPAAEAEAELMTNRLYRRAAWSAARADPLRVARLAVVKQGRFWRPWPVGGLPGGAAGFALQAGFAAFFLPLAGLAVWGGVVLWRVSWPHASRVQGRTSEAESNVRPDTRDACGHDGLPRPWAVVLTWGPVLGFAAICLAFVGSVRYRLPGEFPLAVAAAVGGLDAWGRLRASRRPPAGGSTGG